MAFMSRATRFDVRNAGNSEGKLEPTCLLVNPLGKELTPSQLQELRRIEDDYYSMLASEGEVAYSIYQDAYKDFITNDRFVRLTRAPTEADRRPKGNSQYHSSAVVDNGGWWMVLDFRSEDYPQLQSQLEQIMHLKAERFAALQAFIEGI